MNLNSGPSKEVNIGEKYSFLWLRTKGALPAEGCHFASMQEVIPEKIARGKIGLDLGCGCGWDTYVMARDNPSLRIIAMDISDGVYVARKLNLNLPNVAIIKGSAGQIPLKKEVCNFVYSFGVLHHLSDYRRGFSEIKRVLKNSSPCFLYLYEDHSDNPVKYLAIKIINIIRKVTVKILPQVLYMFSLLFSPIIVLLFSYPAKLFKNFKTTYKLYEKIPFNFGKSLFSLAGDLYDRFSTPIEHRFNRQGLYKLFQEFSFSGIKITKLKATSGWVVWGYKNR